MPTQLIVLVIIGSVLVYGCAAQTPPKTISVCDLVRNIQKLDGQVVKVQGILRSPNDPAIDSYFDEIVGDRCTGMGEVVVHIVSPDSHFLAAPPKGYRPDFESVHRAENIISAAQRKTSSTRFVATVEGVAVKLALLKSSDFARPLPHGNYAASVILAAIRNVKPIR